jgi:hypothetical protein
VRPRPSWRVAISALPLVGTLVLAASPPAFAAVHTGELVAPPAPSLSAQLQRAQLLATPGAAPTSTGGIAWVTYRGTLLAPPPPPPPPPAPPSPPAPPPHPASTPPPAPAPSGTTGTSPGPGPGYQIPAALAPIFACIRHYESNDNYQDTANPGYRGAYQFSWSTWQWLGGQGDPAAAPPWLQNYMAVQLLQRQGWSAWETAPLCGV